MPKEQKNANIGMVACGYMGCTKLAAVRRNRSGRLYTFCLDCGQLEPRNLGGADLEGGQSRILERARIWGEDGKPPPDTPWWIADNWHSAKRAHDPRCLQPWGGPAEPAPADPPPEPENPTVPTPPKAKPRPKAKPKAKEQPAPRPDDPEPRPRKPARAPEWWD